MLASCKLPPCFANNVDIIFIDGFFFLTNLVLFALILCLKSFLPGGIFPAFLYFALLCAGSEEVCVNRQAGDVRLSSTAE